MKLIQQAVRRLCSLGADPTLVTEARAAARRVLSGAYSRETLQISGGGGGAAAFSAHEMQLAASCCIYGRQKWGRGITIVCTGGVCGVELMGEAFQPPGSGRLTLLGAGESVGIAPGQAYYIRGEGHGQSRLLMVSVPPLVEGCLVQDADGSFPPPASPTALLTPPLQ